MPRDGTATKERILDAAERLVIDNGFNATSLDQVIAESRTSKGSFFHHFASKTALAEALVERYAAADIAHLESALAATREITDPAERVLGFIRVFEDGADELMSVQSGCLYVAVLTERQLAVGTANREIVVAIKAWRSALAILLRDALDARRPGHDIDCDALADHVFVTFEGAFTLCRSLDDPAQMRAQLRVLRHLVAALLGVPG